MTKKTKAWLLFTAGTAIIALTSGFFAAASVSWWRSRTPITIQDALDSQPGITLKRMAHFRMESPRGYAVIAQGAIVRSPENPPFDLGSIGMLPVVKPVADTVTLFQEGQRNGVFERVEKFLKPYGGHLSVGKDLLGLTGDVPLEAEKLVIDSLVGGLHAESVVMLIPKTSDQNGLVSLETVGDVVKDFRAGAIELAKPYLFDSHSKPVVIFNVLRSKSRQTASVTR